MPPAAAFLRAERLVGIGQEQIAGRDGLLPVVLLEMPDAVELKEEVVGIDRGATRCLGRAGSAERVKRTSPASCSTTVTGPQELERMPPSNGASTSCRSATSGVEMSGGLGVPSTSRQAE